MSAFAVWGAGDRQRGRQHLTGIGPVCVRVRVNVCVCECVSMTIFVIEYFCTCVHRKREISGKLDVSKVRRNLKTNTVQL